MQCRPLVDDEVVDQLAIRRECLGAYPGRAGTMSSIVSSGIYRWSEARNAFLLTSRDISSMPVLQNLVASFWKPL